MDRVHAGTQATYIDRDIDDLDAFLALPFDEIRRTFNVVIIAAGNDCDSMNWTGG